MNIWPLPAPSAAPELSPWHLLRSCLNPEYESYCTCGGKPSVTVLLPVTTWRFQHTGVKCPESGCSSVSLIGRWGFSVVSSTWLHTDLHAPAAPRVWTEQDHKKDQDMRKWVDGELATKMSQNDIKKERNPFVRLRNTSCSCRSVSVCIRH